MLLRASTHWELFVTLYFYCPRCRSRLELLTGDSREVSGARTYSGHKDYQSGLLLVKIFAVDPESRAGSVRL